MARRHLIELHEQPWCPAILRHGVQAVLQQISSTLPAYEAVLDMLLEAVEASGSTEIVDLCAGAGGPWARLSPAVVGDPRLTRVRLTDIFPDPGAMQAMNRQTSGLTEAFLEPVDAQAVPRELGGFRTV